MQNKRIAIYSNQTLCLEKLVVAKQVYFSCPYWNHAQKILPRMNPLYPLKIQFLKFCIKIITPSTSLSSNLSLPCRLSDRSNYAFLTNYFFSTWPTFLTFLNIIVIIICSTEYKLWNSSSRNFLHSAVTFHASHLFSEGSCIQSRPQQ